MSLPDPNAPPETIILKNFKGLRNNVRPERLALNEFEKAQNVDIDDAEQVSRRRGYTRKITGSWHSVYTSLRGTTYGVKDGVFGVVNPNYTFRAIQNNAGVRPLDFAEIADTLYFTSLTNSYQMNMVTEAVSPWCEIVSAGVWHSPVVRPTATLGEVAGKLLGAPPNGSYITVYNGRIYIARENVLWATELFFPNYVDKTRGFMQFENAIGGVRTVSDGMFVGTSDGVYFLSGEFGQMQRRKVSVHPLIAGSMVAIPADRVPAEVANGAKQAVAMLTADGFCIGLDGGQFTNMTNAKFEFPRAQSAVGMVRELDGFTQYVGVTNSVGDPVNTARIGDFVEAEIVRFNQGA